LHGGDHSQASSTQPQQDYATSRPAPPRLVVGFIVATFRFQKPAVKVVSMHIIMTLHVDAPSNEPCKSRTGRCHTGPAGRGK
jgi:hypothetical protein